MLKFAVGLFWWLRAFLRFPPFPIYFAGPLVRPQSLFGESIRCNDSGQGPGLHAFVSHLSERIIARLADDFGGAQGNSKVSQSCHGLTAISALLASETSSSSESSAAWRGMAV